MAEVRKSLIVNQVCPTDANLAAKPPRQGVTHPGFMWWGRARSSEMSIAVLSGPPVMAILRKTTLCGVRETSIPSYDGVERECQSVVFWRLCIFMGGAYLRPSTASIATRIRICGVI